VRMKHATSGYRMTRATLPNGPSLIRGTDR
jgi:hypothetical protein